MAFDVLVLGVGGMGAAALAHLAGRGLSAIGVEQDDVPSLRGSSVGQTRIIRKAYYEDERYVPLLHRAYELWHELEKEGETLYVRTGCLNLGPAEHPDVRGVLESARLHSLAHERLDTAEVKRRFPAFVPSDGDIGVYEEDAGYLRVEACTNAHAKLAQKRGAELRTRARVTSLSLTDGVHVTLASGEEIRAKKLVLSAGAWLASPLFAPLASDLPRLDVTRQLQLWFEPKDEALARAPKMPAFIHFVPDRAYYGLPLIDESPGIKVCRHHGGETTAADALDRNLRPEDERDVRSYIDLYLPNAGGPLVHAQPCMYTSTPDCHFVVGKHPREENVVVLGGFSGHGYKMASVIGEIAAELVIDGKTKLDIGLFDPTRFSRG